MGLTTDPNDPRLAKYRSKPGPDEAPTPQQDVYLVLSEEERAKGFVEPLRRAYRHVGDPGPVFPLRDLTDDEQHHRDYGYVKFETYPESEAPRTGRFWTQEQLDSGRGCGAETTMGAALCETYARNPRFYSGTYCVGCKMHRPLAEFVWVEDGLSLDMNLREKLAARAAAAEAAAGAAAEGA